MLFETTNDQKSLELPVMQSHVSAGLPSPTADYVEGKLDLNAHLIKRPAASLIIKVTGDSMKDAGIFEGDYAIVDRSLTPRDGDVVIAALNGELTIKTLQKTQASCRLLPANKAYSVIEITEDTDFTIWGVVTAAIHRFRKS